MVFWGKSKSKSFAYVISLGSATHLSGYDLYALVLLQKPFKNCPHNDKLQSSNIIKYFFLSQAKIWQIFSLHCALGQRGRQSQTWNNLKNTQLRRLRESRHLSASWADEIFTLWLDRNRLNSLGRMMSPRYPLFSQPYIFMASLLLFVWVEPVHVLTMG